MYLPRTEIEYLTHCWNFFPGCDNPSSVCFTRELCWARRDAIRFNGNKYIQKEAAFLPKYRDDIFWAKFPRKPARIGVCFTGDLFGPWVSDEIIRSILVNCEIMFSQHTFVFLTKNPKRLARFNPWPPNAWVGMSITGAEPWERQKGRYNALLDVEGGKRWISYEPMLKAWQLSLEGIDWLVVGAQSGPGAIKPKSEWIQDIIKSADIYGVPIWLKRSLHKLYPELPKRQEMPK